MGLILLRTGELCTVAFVWTLAGPSFLMNTCPYDGDSEESEGGGETWSSLFLTPGQICQTPCSLMAAHYGQEVFTLYYFIESFHSKIYCSCLKTSYKFLTFLSLGDMGSVSPLESELTCDCSDLYSVVGMTL